MESTGVAGRVQISRSCYERVHDLGYQFEEREPIEVKGKIYIYCSHFQKSIHPFMCSMTHGHP